MTLRAHLDMRDSIAMPYPADPQVGPRLNLGEIAVIVSGLQGRGHLRSRLPQLRHGEQGELAMSVCTPGVVAFGTLAQLGKDGCGVRE